MDDLEKLTARFPLPDGVPDAVLNRQETADAFSVSLPTVTSWIRDGMPVVREGGNGVEYEIRLSHAWAWRKAKQAAEEERSSEAQQAVAAMRLAMIGGKSGNSIQALPPKERREIYEVQAAHEKLARERNMTLLREDVEDMVTSLMRLFRDGVTAQADRLEKILKLSPAQTETVIQSNDDFLGEMERIIARYWEARAPREEQRTGLFDLQ